MKLNRVMYSTCTAACLNAQQDHFQKMNCSKMNDLLKASGHLVKGGGS
jgi:hypothetical protein